MNSRWILFLLIACGVVGADANKELEFARRLGARGLDGMADEILDGMISSGQPDRVRAGRYGKALLKKQDATIARLRFERALEEGATPPVTREEVLRLYEAAGAPIEDYVNRQKEALEPSFLLGELLQEHAEFLTGTSYPDLPELESVVVKLVEDNRDAASKLFDKALANYRKAVEPYVKGEKQIPEDPGDPIYVRLTNAQMQAGITLFRHALIYRKGATFTYKMDEAIELLDDFLQKHYEELFGAYAMIFIGRGFYEKGVRQGEFNSLEIALGYFETVYNEVDEQPSIPETIDIVAQSFYWHTRSCNVIAQGGGALKKARPIFFDQTIAAGSRMRQKLKFGINHRYALLARLEVAEAFAARENFEDAVATAGEVLTTARIEGHRRVVKQATAKLTNWVASVSGAGALAPGLLFQIGESLLNQGRTANAITFFEKAVSSSANEEDREKSAYPARLRIARALRRDSRLFAAGAVAWKLVEDYLANPDRDEDSAFGQTASEACNQARLAWKSISEKTKRGADKAQYKTVLDTFRKEFPGHRENSDAAFSNALEIYSRGEFAEAATTFRDISPTSRNYWRAQRQVPVCYRRLATDEPDAAKKKEWHTKCLEASRALVRLAEAKSGEPAAQKARQYGHLYTAMSLGSLEQWGEAVQSLKDYLVRYPKQYLKHGLEYYLLIRGYIATGATTLAEQTLAQMKRNLPGSSYVSKANYDVFDALRKEYRAKGKGDPQFRVIAGRAAKLWEEKVNAMQSPSVGDLYVLGDVNRDAGNWQAAGDAFADAAAGINDANAKSRYELMAAQMKFMAANEGRRTNKITKGQFDRILEETRVLFTNVLIPDKTQQKKLLVILGDYKDWPSRAQWADIKRRADVLLDAARVYSERIVEGVDGRVVAMRLIDHLHSFTKPILNAEDPDDRLNEYVDEWWDGAELKLQLAVAVAQSSSGQKKKTVAGKGYSFARKLAFQYSKMDGPERVKRIKALEDKLKVLAR